MTTTTPLSPTCSQCVEATGTCFPGPCKWFASKPAVVPVPAISGYLNTPCRSRERAALDLALAELDELTSTVWGITSWRVDRVRKVRARIAAILGEGETVK